MDTESCECDISQCEGMYVTLHCDTIDHLDTTYMSTFHHSYFCRREFLFCAPLVLHTQSCLREAELNVKCFNVSILHHTYLVSPEGS